MFSFVKIIIPKSVRRYIKLKCHNLAVFLKQRTGKCLSLSQTSTYYILSDEKRKIYISSPMRWTKYKQGIERRIENVLSDYGEGVEYQIEPGNLIIDIGANIGEFSIGMAQRGALVYAIEADKLIYEPLLKNTSSYETIYPYNSALWSEEGEIEFYSSPDGGDSSFIEPERTEASYILDATTLDNFCKARNIEEITLIKCDAEGAEPEVFSGALKMLQKTKWVAIDCGFERQGESTIVEISALLEQHGFQILSKNRTENPRQMVVAKRI